MKFINIECRNCNNYFQVGRRNGNYSCPNCNTKEELIILDRKKEGEISEKEHNSS